MNDNTKLSAVEPEKKSVVKFASMLQDKLGVKIEVVSKDVPFMRWDINGKIFTLSVDYIKSPADKGYFWQLQVNNKTDYILGDIEDYNASEIAKLIKNRYKKLYEAKKETTTAQIATFQTKLGGDPEEGKCKEGFIWDSEQKKCVPVTNEDTVSGQAVGSPSVGAVAGTDTRFGGASFEPVSFDKKSKENDALRNEKVFYTKKEKNIVLPDFEYLSDYISRTGSKSAKSKVDLDSLRYDDLEDNALDDESIEKKKSAIDWKLDGPKKNYKQILQKLRKAHNI